MKEEREEHRYPGGNEHTSDCAYCPKAPRKPSVDEALTADERERVRVYFHDADVDPWYEEAVLRLIAQVERMEDEARECRGQAYSSNPREQSHAFQIEHAAKRCVELTAKVEALERALKERA